MSIEAIPGESIDFESTREKLAKLKPKVLFKPTYTRVVPIKTPEGKDPLYDKYISSKSKLTFAEYCSKRLPF